MSTQERRLREKEERFAAIRRAATAIFAAKGLQEATMDEIAQLAQLSKGTIYYYYPSKEALIEDLVKSNLPLFFEDLCDGSAATPLALSEGIVARFLERFAAHPEAFKVLYLVLAEGTDPRSDRSLRLQGAIDAFRIAHLHWLVELEEHVRPLLQQNSELSVREVVDFVGTHFHGILM
ncbi:MAG: TetR/AcrR family transcriptional regulator, partial [Candidatus Bipolaricaulota bacterium]|nr:TetR/AcrR family transcriptional regulator [Candidatus Bipolaricaulota bacterium]